MTLGGAVAVGLTSLVALGCAAHASPVDAQEREPRPVLGGHRLIWNPVTQSPFPRTMVRSLSGGGLFSNVEFFPEFDLGEDVTVEAVKGDLLFAELEFEYMYQVQPWLGVWARAGGVARLGTDTGGLLAQGVTAIVGYELGWLVKLHEGRSFVLSGTAALSNDNVTDVDLLRWARGIVQNEPDSTLTSSGPQLRGRVGVRGAWGINPMWGLQFQSELGHGQLNLDGDESRFILDSAASLSMDLYPRIGVPLGFVLSGSTRGFPREGGDPDVRTLDVGIRTAFTGRDAFLIALDTSWNGFDLRDGDDVSLIRVGLALQLYF